MLRQIAWVIAFCGLGSLCVEAALAGWFLNKEQQGQAYFIKEDFLAAAHFFEDDYKSGVALYRAGRYQQAEQAFARVKRGEVALDALYNLGNSRFRQGNYAQAIEAYEALLQKNQQHKDGKYNLRLSKLRLKKESTKQTKEEKQKRKDAKENQAAQQTDKKQQSNQEQSKQQKASKQPSQDSKKNGNVEDPGDAGQKKERNNSDKQHADTKEALEQGAKNEGTNRQKTSGKNKPKVDQKGGEELGKGDHDSTKEADGKTNVNQPITRSIPTKRAITKDNLSEKLDRKQKREKIRQNNKSYAKINQVNGARSIKAPKSQLGYEEKDLKGGKKEQSKDPNSFGGVYTQKVFESVDDSPNKGKTNDGGQANISKKVLESLLDRIEGDPGTLLRSRFLWEEQRDIKRLGVGAYREARPW